MPVIAREDCAAALALPGVFSETTIPCTAVMAVLFDMLLEEAGPPVVDEDGQPLDFLAYHVRIGEGDAGSNLHYQLLFARWDFTINANSSMPWSASHWLQAHIMSLPRDRWEGAVCACIMFLNEHGS